LETGAHACPHWHLHPSLYQLTIEPGCLATLRGREAASADEDLAVDLYQLTGHLWLGGAPRGFKPRQARRQAAQSHLRYGDSPVWVQARMAG
jgi:hypothetical protein